MPSTYLEILREIKIPAEVIKVNDGKHMTGKITLKIPPDHVLAAVLALEQHGFSDIRNYEDGGLMHKSHGEQPS